MSHSVITHTGIIKKQFEQSVEVCIESKSACSACHAKGACNLSDLEEKSIIVPTTHTTYSIGEKVVVKMKETQGFYALFLAYIVPFILLFITLLIASAYTSELNAGISSLLILVPYYTVLYFFKNHFQKRLSYELEKI